MERLVAERNANYEMGELTSVPSPRSAEDIGNRELPRKAKKYVFFNVANGNLMFEYGGIQSPVTFKNPSGEDVIIYELGCLVKEIREENFDP